MTTYSFPSIKHHVQNWALTANAAIFDSYNNTVTVSRRGGERWEVELVFPALKGEDLATMRAFITKLNGQEHRFTLSDISHTQRGTFGGTPVVDGASQTGSSLDIRGASINTANWIREGDFFQVGSELKQVLADVTTDGSGDATITFGPRIRTSPSDGAPITTTAPTATFLIAQPRTVFAMRPGGVASLSLTAIEDVTATP